MDIFFLFQLRVDGYDWSTPFSISNEGMMRVSLKNGNGSDQLFFKVEVRSGTKSSRYEVIFRPNSSSSPYRLHDTPMLHTFKIYLNTHRMVDGVEDFMFPFFSLYFFPFTTLNSQAYKGGNLVVELSSGWSSKLSFWGLVMV